MPSATAALGRADRVVESLLLRFHFGFGWRPHADNGDAAGELGQSLLQFLAVVLAGSFFNLAADLLDACVDPFAIAPSADDCGFVFVHDNAFGASKLFDRDMLEGQA